MITKRKNIKKMDKARTALDEIMRGLKPYMPKEPRVSREKFYDWTLTDTLKVEECREEGRSRFCAL